MARAKTKILDLNSALLQQGKTAAGTQSLAPVVAETPVSEMPLVLTLDEVNPNPDNPRTTRNPKYDDIKASIRARGLDTVPKVTRDPERPELGYFFSDGGNTRYAILSELWQETGEDRFYRFSCVFKPWPGRLSCVIGHLAENEVRGDLTFIEKAFGIKQARQLFEEQLGKTVSLRELSTLLGESGYPVHNSNISRMEDTIQYLYPYIPRLLESGLGRPQIQLLLALRGNADKTWQRFIIDVEVTCTFDAVFGAVCSHFDDPEIYSLDMFRDELIGALINALPHPLLNYDRWLLELDPKEQNRRKHLGEPTLTPELSGKGNTVELAPALQQDNTGGPTAPEVPSGGSSLVLDSALLESMGDSDEGSQETQEEETPTTKTEPRVETQPDLYGAPSVLSGDVETVLDGENTTVNESPLPGTHESTAPHSNTEIQTKQGVTPAAEVSFAEVVLEPVSSIWAISALQDDIEHLQVITFRLAFELAEVAGCEAEIKADKADLQAAGYALTAERPSRFTALLLTLAGNNPDGASSSSLNEALIGSENAADWPLLDDIHAVKLMRLIRVLRRLRELQRDLPATEETA
ncbi:ParB family protein [Serratia marcescens]|uniref:ParB family protein n=1 Tax=Serratia marcescens TaxID=615 RepID=UPI00044923CC|nr:ParB family protein [Serratia marcescens]EIM8480807.1 ParB family protein [Serratia marcescens]EIV5187748.1 ParB family protein [Serratia marcescens]ETX44546.1 integrating conjugative element, PFGI_1 class, ParB family protein [Serratia marcescens BIDMC 44]MBH2621334.1 ParB family protein [Serratia marcescens]MBI6198480.1 ParB family protein [Serratia marcescens]